MIAQIIKKILFPFFRVVFVGIHQKGRVCAIVTRIYQNKKLIKQERREFEMPDGSPSQLMVEYLMRLERRNTYTYFATALSSINQGVIPGRDPEFFEKMSIDTDNIITISIDNRSTIYGSAFDIEEIRGKYAAIDGIDYIFPTESIIDFMRQNINARIEENEAFALLLCDKTAATLAIYQGDIFTYSSHIIFDDDEDAADLSSANDISDIFSAELSNDEIDDKIAANENINDDFNSIEDLNSFIASDDPMSLYNPDEELQSEESAPMLDLDDESPQSNIRKNMPLFNFLKSSFSNFYKNKNYDSGFVEKIAIFDTANEGKSAADYVKKELCIEPVIYPIDIAEVLCDLSYKEASL